MQFSAVVNFSIFLIPQDPLKEVAVMQYLSTAGGHVNILGITEAVQDENAVRFVCVVQRFLKRFFSRRSDATSTQPSSFCAMLLNKV
jgi:hypothetical protein